jgi:hypothetical protein
MGLDRTVSEDRPLGVALRRGQLLLLAACDSGYVEYVTALIRSLDVFSPGERVCVHVVNPTDDALADLQRSRSLLRHTELIVSTERVDLGALTPVQRRTYYACARFLRLAELLEQADGDLLVLDADSLVVSKIDRDFTDKLEAEVCLRRRDLLEQQPEHLAVAAGSVWVRATEASRAFFRAVANDLVSAFESGEASWYLDQITLMRRIGSPELEVKVRNIKSKYADWDFRDDSIIWQAKGHRKYLDVRYLLLQSGLSSQRRYVDRAAALYAEFERLVDNQTVKPINRRLEALLSVRPRRAVFLLPRLDLPWKLAGMRKGLPPCIDPDALELRLYWVRFLAMLANQCERAGLEVEIRQVPAWEIDRKLVESLLASVVLVPHRCHFDFEDGPTPVFFYMQEYFRWMFVVDRQGWSAASSLYPMRPPLFESAPTGAFDHYRTLLNAGQLQSKFAQPPSIRPSPRPSARFGLNRTLGTAKERWDPLRARWIVPAVNLTPAEEPPMGAQAVPSVFFPMQIPHDQSIKYFSRYSVEQVLDALVVWAEQAGVVLNIKPHPANWALTSAYQARHPESTWVRWRDEGIHDLIEEADAVFTINSGTGMEALLHCKAVVTFGEAEYDCVTTRATLDNIESAWEACRSDFASDREARYRAFFDWFAQDYAVDLSRPQAAAARLARIAAEIAAASAGNHRQLPERNG